MDDSPDDDEAGRKHAWGLRLVYRTQALMERHGKGVLWRGILPVLVAMGVSNFVYFYTHSRLKGCLALLRRRGGHVGEKGLRGHLADLSVAAIAGIVNVLITTPLWVASTRAKLSTQRQPEAIWTALHRIYRYARRRTHITCYRRRRSVQIERRYVVLFECRFSVCLA